jgi:hypothetical protein
MATIVTADKMALINKSRTWKIVLWAVILIAAVLVTWLVIVEYKKYKLKKANQANLGGQQGGGASSAQPFTAPIPKYVWTPETTNSSPTYDTSSPDVIKTVQKLINQITPSAVLVVDGIMGPKTEAALKAIDPTYYPITENVIMGLTAKAAAFNAPTINANINPDTTNIHAV